ncbi:MAG TPA: CPBP family intramembrane glutamic endopeptidase [Gemmatimonadaceae bacterium]|nr:CPBP family intramembrane glutamic endopeptidase [Gemmatimonadaceae bacterium]
MPHLADAVFGVLVVVAYPLWDYFVSWPRAKARLLAGEPNARWRLYRAAILTQWIAVAFVAGLWIAFGRPAADLFLRLPAGPWLIGSIGLVIGVVTVFVAQVAGVARANAERRAALRPRLGYATLILPHDTTEHRWFVPLALTAGFCEEVVYRGFLIWLFASSIGLWAAAAVSVAIFGVSHAYMGRTGAVRATVAGAIFAALAVALRSLIPGMVLHAVIDLAAGSMGYLILGETSTVADVPSL